MDEHQVILSESSPLRYFHILPNIADELLSVYEYRLYGHYVRVCGAQNKPCFESNRTTAKRCGMSHPMVMKVRTKLEEMGFIRVQRLQLDHKDRVAVTLLDVWPRNSEYFVQRKREQKPRQPTFAEMIEAQFPGDDQTSSTARSTSRESSNGTGGSQSKRRASRENHYQPGLKANGNEGDPARRLVLDFIGYVAPEWDAPHGYVDHLSEEMLRCLLEWLVYVEAYWEQMSADANDEILGGKGKIKSIPGFMRSKVDRLERPGLTSTQRERMDLLLERYTIEK